MAVSSNRSWLPTMAYIVAAVVILLDQWAKHYVTMVMHMEPGFSVSLTDFLNLTLVLNRGVSFGLFRSPEGQEWGRWILAVFAGGVSVALAIWVRKVHRLLPALAIGLIIGGALGNLSDRIRLGRVVDFIDFSRGIPWFPWVFNVADVAVNIGVILLLLDMLLVREKPGTAAKSPT